MERGIYVLANDNVWHQLVALLNSIEANYSKDIAVCVIPYDENLERVRAEIVKRPQVSLFEDTESIRRWEEFAISAWGITHSAKRIEHRVRGRYKLGKERIYRLGMHRKFCAFDGPFEKFVFMDADTILMQPLDFVFEKLDKFDFVTYDYQFKDPSHVFNVKSQNLNKIFPQERVSKEIFCAGFFASKHGLFDNGKLKYILEKLKEGDAEILYPSGPDQSLLNYMVMKSNLSVYNFALELPYEKRTGNSVTSTHFEEKGHLLYDRGNRLTYLHYIGLHAEPFIKLCIGENIDFPYRDIFLYYRYLREPGKRPQFRGKPKPYSAPLGFAVRVWRKLKRIGKAQRGVHDRLRKD